MFQLSAEHAALVVQANTLRKQAGKSEQKSEQKRLYDEALQGYKKVIHANKCAEAEYGLGVVHRKLGQHEDAVHHFRESLFLDPAARGGAVWDNLGTSLLKLHRFELALDAYNQAVRITPENKNYERGRKQALALWDSLQTVINAILTPI